MATFVVLTDLDPSTVHQIVVGNKRELSLPVLKIFHCNFKNFRNLLERIEFDLEQIWLGRARSLPTTWRISTQSSWVNVLKLLDHSVRGMMDFEMQNDLSSLHILAPYLYADRLWDLRSILHQDWDCFPARRSIEPLEDQQKRFLWALGCYFIWNVSLRIWFLVRAAVATDPWILAISSDDWMPLFNTL